MTDPLLCRLEELEREFHHPGVRCSRSRLEQLLHPDFHEVGQSGRAYTRDTVIEHLLSQPSPPPVESDDYSLYHLADRCALLTYRSVHRAPDGTVERSALRSSIWLRTDTGWQIVYHQGTPRPVT